MVDSTNVNRNTRRQPHWNGKNPAQIPDAAPRSRTALDPVAYDNLIKQHGVRVKVYRSMFCPNVKSVDGGEHNIDCTLCNGSGYLDVDPIESVAYLSNQNFQEEMTVEGYHDGNSVGGTFLGGVELQYFTRVDLMDFTQPFYERVLRKTGTVFPAPAVPGVTGVNASFDIVFPTTLNLPPAVDFAGVSNVVNSAAFFENITGPATSNISIFGEINTTGVNYEVSGTDLGIIADSTGITTGAQLATELARVINLISTDRTMPTDYVDRVTGMNVGTFISLSTASANGTTLTISKRTQEPLANLPEAAGGSTNTSFGNVIQGVTAVTPVPEVLAANTRDNLRYDCRRVNVLIDKSLEQYYQDIDFNLTPQGNIQWFENNRRPADGVIYTVHYESVIQYRAISAMHINRFAQVPDRSTGLVAQVKMPEQWMLQKEFLIIRRDKYGNEIKQTGIYGDIIAAQPLNPAPADTI